MKKKRVRFGACALALALTAGAVRLPSGAVSEVQAAGEECVDDIMEVRTEDGGSTVLQIYSGGIFEGELELPAGSHTLSLYRNGAESGITDEVNVSEAGSVYVRYEDGALYNSADDAGAGGRFHTAALTGNFTGLEFTDSDGNSYAIGNWDPADANAELEYRGGGIYSRTFEFHELAEDITIADSGYKVAFDDGWEYSLGKNGAGDSSNIPLTIPAGTDHLTVFVDEQRGIAYDSVRTAPMNIYQNAGSVTSPAFETTVSLIGTVRQSGDDDWNAAAEGYEFTQISDSLYRYQQTFDTGSYQYKAVFDHQYWYESFGGENKSLDITADGTNVIFVYDAAADRLYDTVNDENIVAQMFGFAAEPAEAEVRDNADGSTTFIMTGTENDEVKLFYAPSSQPASFTEVKMEKGMDSNANFNGSFVAGPLYLGDGELDYLYYYTVNGVRTLDPSGAEVTEIP